MSFWILVAMPMLLTLVFKSLAKNGGVKIYYKNGSLKCANGSLIDIIGYSILPVTVGSKHVSVKMTIVRDIFPNVILGMKSMRALRLSVNPAKECAQIEGDFPSKIEDVPFISQTKKQQENF